ncbi:precorrin-2 C20-methyltransferase/precorrin-3B C17-methyltransferase [Gordonia hirsuta DSM 44140 = NBRC 16056]|uniref:Precorrin-2 C20-methyltransferase/precorrin-3B C17-methyltransferase n=1 Tax=Gordonia hirsuta DSM 44140 = NBRC 16056 TaxID=1121927 RepID=L7L5U0_9ACTN|nr:precorrin-2 C20-methyltransferase/precorrin-3B C17-methyltransferase [Gordonia hirsuta DSM 44140 = NBRC 16056]
MQQPRGRGAGKLWGVGLGPGDPELVTVKAARIIADADVIAYHCARHGNSIARSVAEPYLRSGQVEERLMYPLTVETTDHPGGYAGAMADFYRDSAELLAEHLAAGRDVVLLAEGDPLFFSSYMHMHKRLAGRFDAEIIPGVTSISGASAALGIPLVEGEETLTVLPGTAEPGELVAHLRTGEALAVMKLGRTFGKVRQALAEAGRLEEAWYVERASTSRQQIAKVVDVDPASVPYFSLIVVPGRRNNPLAATPAGADDESGIGTPGEVVVVGLGPGPAAQTTPQVSAELAAATDLVGYTTYLKRITPRTGQRVHATDNRVETQRAEFALDLASKGSRVAVVSSGDPGVFAMAAAVTEVASEPAWQHVPVRVVPGVSAAQAVAAAAGAPLGHDFAIISLSDLLKPWSVIEQRIRAAVDADLVFAVYNPASRTRTEQIRRFQELLNALVPADRVLIQGRDVGGDGQRLQLLTVADFDPATVDMRTLLIVGSSQTRIVRRPAGDLAFTPRHYPQS